MDRLGQMNQNVELKTSNPGKFSEYPGGAALNSASIFTALGGIARLHSMLGNDSAAQEVRGACQQRSIALSDNYADATATYTALLNADGTLVVALADMAAYDHFDAKSILPAITSLEKCQWLFIDANLPAGQLKIIAESARCPVAASAVSMAKCERLIACLPKLDVLFCTRTEATALFKLPQSCNAGEIALAAQSAKLKSLVVSDGEHPIICAQNGRVEFILVPPVDPIVDVTGAGDALAAGTLYDLCRGILLAQSVCLGIKAAQSVLDTVGPWRQNLSHLPVPIHQS